jgi:hypothetical protein
VNRFFLRGPRLRRNLKLSKSRKSRKSHCCYQTANVMFITLAGFEYARQGKSRASQVSKTEAFTKLVPSAKADSVCSTFAFPALPCRAFRCRCYAAGAEFVPPSRRSVEFRNTLKPRDLGALYNGGASELSCGCRVGTEQTAALLKDDPAGKAGLLKPEIHS